MSTYSEEIVENDEDSTVDYTQMGDQLDGCFDEEMNENVDYGYDNEEETDKERNDDENDEQEEDDKEKNDNVEEEDDDEMNDGDSSDEETLMMTDEQLNKELVSNTRFMNVVTCSCLLVGQER